MAGVKGPLSVTKGKKTQVFMALLKDGDREAPAEVTLTLGSGAAKGATSLSISGVSADTTKIYKGQYLLFEDPDERLFIAQANADYTGGSSLTVVALPEAIPNASAAAFPVPFKLRTSADVDVSTDANEVDTFDHSINGDATPGKTSFEFKTDGEYSAFDPGYNTCVYAQRNATEVYVWRRLAAPSPAFAKGKVTSGAAIVTSRSEPNPNDGNVGASVSCRFVGDVEEDDPVAIA